jgi:hypothetical protein
MPPTGFQVVVQSTRVPGGSPIMSHRFNDLGIVAPFFVKLCLPSRSTKKRLMGNSFYLD